jgi:hypothetical protein
LAGWQVQAANVSILGSFLPRSLIRLFKNAFLAVAMIAALYAFNKPQMNQKISQVFKIVAQGISFCV